MHFFFCLLFFFYFFFNTFLTYTYLFLFSSVVSSYSGLFFRRFCTVTFTRFTTSRHTLPPIEVDYSDSHNSQLDMVHKQACMVVHMPCNCTVVFGRQLCNYSGSSAGGFLEHNWQEPVVHQFPSPIICVHVTFLSSPHHDLEVNSLAVVFG